nr:immunoglobulin light chain junction region [Macaca mulatta]MOV34119.1 immunoglobulin light chain junction region [Macaca mulatta]MOV34178.1 immunoglobulin light chain junction region [Macaca mulatta]MOV34225.1 immunoglobulin light chain junction region [Macaca mulatta]MOV34312.1 immunoglobulin light chain junction region [Macaca mulatta]
CQKYSSPPYSF